MGGQRFRKIIFEVAKKIKNKIDETEQWQSERLKWKRKKKKVQLLHPNPREKKLNSWEKKGIEQTNGIELQWKKK